MLRLAFDFIITWRETRTRPNAYFLFDSIILRLVIYAYKNIYNSRRPNKNENIGKLTLVCRAEKILQEKYRIKHPLRKTEQGCEKIEYNRRRRNLPNKL